MDCDVEKLIAAVEIRPAIYDFTLKEYKIRHMVEKAWKEVASEIKIPVVDCKIKWGSLRSAYNRALRETEHLSSGSKGGKRKRWHLMDSLEFLQPFTGTQRKCNTNISSLSSTFEEVYVPKQETSDTEEEEENFSASTSTVIPVLPSPPQSKASSAAEKGAGSTIEVLNSRTNSIEKESSTLSFFKGIVEEVDSLPMAKRTLFKIDVMKLVGKYMNEQLKE